MNPLGFQRLKVVSLAVDDLARARRFYGETLGLEPAFEGERQVGFLFANVIVMLKPTDSGWYARPSAQLNPRITFASNDAPQTEKALREREVTISIRSRPTPKKASTSAAFSTARATSSGSVHRFPSGWCRKRLWLPSRLWTPNKSLCRPCSRRTGTLPMAMNFPPENGQSR